MASLKYFGSTFSTRALESTMQNAQPLGIHRMASPHSRMERMCISFWAKVCLCLFLVFLGGMRSGVLDPPAPPSPPMMP